MLRLTAGISVVLVSAACAASPAVDDAADRAAIAASTAATEAAENAGSAALMRPQMAPNMPYVAGIDEATHAMEGFLAAFSLQIDYQSEEIVVAGNFGFDRGTYRQTLSPKAGGASINETGKYLWVYRRDADGNWKQSRVIWNSSDPLPHAGG